MYFKPLTFVLLFLPVLAHPGLPPATKQISEEVFTCESSNPVFKAICQVGLNKVNNELEAAGVSIRRDDILFSFDDPTDRSVPTGHSCTRRAKMQHQHFSASFSTSARLHLSGDSLIEPLAVKLTLPVRLNGRVNMVQRFGIKTIFGCTTTLTDHFSFVGSLSTTAQVFMGLALNPSLGMTESGDYALVLEPKVAFLSKLKNTDIRFRVSGANPISAVYAFIAGLTSSVFKSVTALLTGDSASRIIDSIIPNDIIYPLILGVGSLPRPLEEAIFKRFTKIGERATEKAAKGFGKDFEDRLEADLVRGFKLDREGRRTIIIKRDIVNLLRLGGVNTDVFIEPPEDPSKACFDGVRRSCIGSRGSLLPGCGEKFARCAELKRQHERKYSAQGIIPSKSKIEREVESRTPAPAPQTPRRSSQEECINAANQLCSACRGCSECVRRQRECRGLPTEPARVTPTPRTPTPVPAPQTPTRSSQERCIDAANKLCAACRGCSECVQQQRKCRA